MAWNGSTPNAPNWAGDTTPEPPPPQTLSITESIPPAFSNPTISISGGNTVDLPRRYNDFAVNNLTATSINGNPDFDASDWYLYPAKGNVSAELAPINPITPTPRRQYDINDFRTLNATNVNLTQDLVSRGTLTTEFANVSDTITGLNANFSTEQQGTANVNIYGQSLLPSDNALFVSGGTTLTGGGIVHGTTIGALQVGGIDTVRIDVLPAGMLLTSATFLTANAVGAVEIAAGGATSVSAGGVLNLAGGSNIEYNSDQHYFINTTNGNDQTTIFVGNVNGALNGTQPLRIVESRGVEIQNVTSMELQGTETDIYWNKDVLYNVGAKVIAYNGGATYRALVQNKGLFPLSPYIPAWIGGTQDYVVGNIVALTGVDNYRCIQNVNAPASTPNSDGASWVGLGQGTNEITNIWVVDTPVAVVPSTISGDFASIMATGTMNTNKLQLFGVTFDDWNGNTIYYAGDQVNRFLVNNGYYYAKFTNRNLDPRGALQPWASNSNYAEYEFVIFSGNTYVCLQDVSGSTTNPASDPTNWLNLGNLTLANIWTQFVPTGTTSSIVGDENSSLTIGSISAGDVNIQEITVPIINTNTINPQTGTSIGLTGDLNMGDHNIANVIELEVNDIKSPAGLQLTLEGTGIDLNAISGVVTTQTDIDMTNNKLLNVDTLEFNPFAKITTESIDGVDYVFVQNPFKMWNFMIIEDTGGNNPGFKMQKQIDPFGPIYDTAQVNYDGATVNIDRPLNVPAITGLNTINGRNLYAYARFLMDTTQQPSAVNTDDTIAINVDDTPSGALGLSLGANQITCLVSGLYQITMDAFLFKTAGSVVNTDIWLKKNASNIDNTCSRIHLTGNGTSQNVSKTFLVYLLQEVPEINSADVITAHFGSDNIDVELQYEDVGATVYTAPQRPAFSLTFNLIG